MSIVKKVLILSIFLIFIFYSSCFAIDENQFLSNPGIQITESQTSPDTTLDILDSSAEESTDLSHDDEETTSTSQVPTTTVTSASSDSGNSTLTNILYIALIVIGLLLVLLAIAILIRLNK